MSITQSKLDTCKLCSLQIKGRGIEEDTKKFCCNGCRVVYQILATKGVEGDYSKTPLFHQAVKSGVISNPELRMAVGENRGNLEYRRLNFEIGDMWCPSCAEVIRLILMQEKGIRRCYVDYATDLACVEYAPISKSKEQIFQLIERMGYCPIVLDDGAEKKINHQLWIRFGVTAFFTFNIMMFSYPLYASYFYGENEGNIFAWLSAIASLPVFFYGGWPIIKRFMTSLQVGVIGMEALVILGVGSALGYSWYHLLRGNTHVYFDSMSAIITLMLLGKIIESKAKVSTKLSILQLARSVVKKCRKRLPTGKDLFVPLKEIKAGDRCVVNLGEKIPIDGIVVEGVGSCDESLMTGEPLPIMKRAGEKVIAGTILIQGSLVVEALCTAEKTTLAHIIHVVQDDFAKKGSYFRAADRITPWFVPLVISISFCAAFWNSWEAGVSVLLISCPCALGIAAPLAESYLIHGLASKGVIIRNRGCIPYLGKEMVFVFDKTGTITKGEFEVESGLEKLTKNERSLLKGLSERSNHPICRAISQHLHNAPTKFDKIEEYIGQGIAGWIDGKIYKLGSSQFTNNQDINGKGTVVFFHNQPIELKDSLREEVKEVILRLPGKKVLLSGDGHCHVESIATACGFDEWRARFKPIEKRDYVQNIKEIVCMIGDGINDAPALSAANVGVSVFSATDISIQVSDILLTDHRLSILLLIQRLGKKANQIINQNLFWAFFYNIIGIGFAAIGELHPIYAAGAMVSSSVFVLLNTRRLNVDFE